MTPLGALADRGFADVEHIFNCSVWGSDRATVALALRAAEFLRDSGGRHPLAVASGATPVTMTLSLPRPFAGGERGPSPLAVERADRAARGSKCKGGSKGSWALPNPKGKKLLRPLHLEGAGRTLERLREWGAERPPTGLSA